MTPKLAQAIDPVFLHVLDLLERISQGEEPSPQEERLRIRALIDQAEAIVGGGEEWELGKYAIAAWTDEVLGDAPWAGRDWWRNNVLEMELFNTRLCNEQFFLRAQKATTMSRRDSLEIYYVCVVLGFRGLYSDPHMAQMFINSNGLPRDLETWAKQAAMSIRLGQGRPQLPRPARDVQGAPPLRSKAQLVWPWLGAVMFAAVNVLVFWRVFMTLGFS